MCLFPCCREYLSRESPCSFRMDADSFKSEVDSLADGVGGATIRENDEAERLIIGLVSLHGII